jgi:hypothetical protein
MSQTKSKDQLLANASADNEKIAAVLADAGSDPLPEVPEPPDDLVRLPAGLLRNGGVVKTAVVRELNGNDEEALSKALRSNNIIHFMDVLITRGTEQLGTEAATKDLLKKLLIGDRDELALAIRIATYGDEVVFDAYKCPHCNAEFPLSFSLSEDIERTTLEHPADAVFEVGLRKGRRAKVRLPNGADQEAIFASPDWTPAQRNTVLLTKCVMSITEANGQEFQVVASPSMVLNLSIPDRQKIVAEITERQPGPRYNSFSFTHEECQNEVNLALGVADLFRDLVLFL